MATQKTVQIPWELFRDLYVYFNSEGRDGDPEQLKRQINDKMDKLHSRYLYSKSKTAASQPDRERARQDYLDKKGIPENFRY